MPLLTPAEEIRTFPSRSCVSLKEIKHEEDLAQGLVQGKYLANRPAPLINHHYPHQSFSAIITSMLINHQSHHQQPSSSSSTVLILPLHTITTTILTFNLISHPHQPPSSSSSVFHVSLFLRASLVAQLVKNPSALWETWVRSLGWEDPLEKGMATHSQYSGLENSMDYTVHVVTKSQTQLSNFHFLLS